MEEQYSERKEIISDARRSGTQSLSDSTDRYNQSLSILQHRSAGYVTNCGLTMIFWADACATQYEFIAVNGQTTTPGFHKVV